MPECRRAYISAESGSTATITGPPSTLSLLFSFSESLRTARKIKLPITAPFHAPHLGNPAADEILDLFSNDNDYELKKEAVIISTSSGEPIPGHSLREALKGVVKDILQEPLRWSTVTRSIVSSLRGQSTVLVSAGPIRAADSLRRELANEGVDIVGSFEMQPDAFHMRNPSTDIAIVGIAGRLPGGETLEEIWKILEDGRDVHQRVSSKSPRCTQTLILDRFQRIGLTRTLIAIRPVK